MESILDGLAKSPINVELSLRAPVCAADAVAAGRKRGNLITLGISTRLPRRFAPRNDGGGLFTNVSVLNIRILALFRISDFDIRIFTLILLSATQKFCPFVRQDRISFAESSLTAQGRPEILFVRGFSIRPSTHRACPWQAAAPRLPPRRGVPPPWSPCRIPGSPSYTALSPSGAR